MLQPSTEEKPVLFEQLQQRGDTAARIQQLSSPEPEQSYQNPPSGRYTHPATAPAELRPTMQHRAAIAQ